MNKINFVQNMGRNCPYCKEPKKLRKRNCYNENCTESKPYKEAVKKQKRVEEKNKKKANKTLNPPRTGVSAINRDASTRNGLVVSYSSHHAPVLTEQEIDHRNILLQVDDNVCFWCKSHADEMVMDHAHPCCSKLRSQFSWTNKLNVFPSCRQCNQKKGGKALSAWLNLDVVVSNWSSTQLDTFRCWLSENEKKLLFDSEDTAFIKKQFDVITNFHKVLEYCAKNKKDISEFISIKEDTGLN